jgi:hypothetical protein
MRCSLAKLAAWKISFLAAVAEMLNGTAGGGRGQIGCMRVSLFANVDLFLLEGWD